MSLKEIEKLRDKVAKDPNSKLFVPLADEYRKEGMLDEAIEVLTRGLEKQPSYTSARVALGKIYLEKSLLPDAQREFETVVKSVPDNLFAQKKLAEVYRDTGQRDLAIRSFKSVLRLNPMDEDTIASLKEIESSGQSAASPDAAPAADRPLTLGPADEKTATEEVDHGSEIPLGLEPSHEVKPAASDEELSAFRDMVFSDKSEDDNAAPVLPADEHPLTATEAPGEEALSIVEATPADEELSLDEEPAAGDEVFLIDEEPAAGEELQIVDDTAAVDEEISFEEELPVSAAGISVPEEILAAGEEADTGEAAVSLDAFPGIPELPAGPDEELAIAEPAAPEEQAADAFALDEDLSFGDIAKEVSAGQTPLEADFAVAEELPVPDFAEPPAAGDASGAAGLSAKADNLIAQGNYFGAIETYQKIMALDPDNAATLQRIEELRALLKLMGKDKDVLITKLNAFLDAVHQRRDDFFRRSERNG